MGQPAQEAMRIDVCQENRKLELCAKQEGIDARTSAYRLETFSAVDSCFDCNRIPEIVGCSKAQHWKSVIPRNGAHD